MGKLYPKKHVGSFKGRSGLQGEVSNLHNTWINQMNWSKREEDGAAVSMTAVVLLAGFHLRAFQWSLSMVHSVGSLYVFFVFTGFPLTV